MIYTEFIYIAYHDFAHTATPTPIPTATPTPTPTPTQIPRIALNNALRVTLPQYIAENVRPITNTVLVNIL